MFGYKDITENEWKSPEIQPALSVCLILPIIFGTNALIYFCFILEISRIITYYVILCVSRILWIQHILGGELVCLVLFLKHIFFCAFSDTFYHFIFASASFYQYMAPAELNGKNTFCCIFLFLCCISWNLFLQVNISRCRKIWLVFTWSSIISQMIVKQQR